MTAPQPAHSSSFPHYSDQQVTVHHGDCLDIMAELPDASVDAIVTDPPYGLGFMGKAWDDLPPGLPWAQECLRVLRPGGHLLAFGGTRTWHRLACAVEDAGFEVRDSIAWLYGSGWPKSLDVSKAIDKAAGATREMLGLVTRTPSSGRGNTVHQEGGDKSGVSPITAPATPAAQQWAGWGTALKPAFEPIVVARKPLVGTVAANVLAHGTGALNIDGCRVEGRERTDYGLSKSTRTHGDVYGAPSTSADFDATAGRWPTNVVLGHTEECRHVGERQVRTGTAVRRNLPDAGSQLGTVPIKPPTQRGEDVSYGVDGMETVAAWSCAQGCPVAELDEQTGTLTSGGSDGGVGARSGRRSGIMGEVVPGPQRAREASSGGASRFFPVFKYQAKAPTRERVKVDGIAHPTVKPLALMRWLVRLVTPPGGIVLDPFAGSGTTVEAAVLEGFRCVAIEREADYLPLILQRVQRCAEDDPSTDRLRG